MQQGDQSLDSFELPDFPDLRLILVQLKLVSNYKTHLVLVNIQAPTARAKMLKKFQQYSSANGASEICLELF